MNILILHSSSDLYGASKILLYTSCSLQDRGHQVWVILSEEGPLSDALKKGGVKVHILRLGILRRKYFTPAGLANRFFTIRKAVKSIKALIRENHIDILYSNTTSVLAGALAVKKTDVKHVWHIHEIITQPSWLFRMLGWMVNRYSDHVIVVSKAVREHWKKYIDQSKIEVIHNGIPLQEFEGIKAGRLRSEHGLSPDKVLVGMIGRVHPWKGQEYFLQTAKRVLDKCPHVHFIMVGDAYPGNEYLYEQLDKTKSALGLVNRVTDLGYRNDIPEIMKALDIFVLPSILPDPLPTVVLEAMASGIPVVATAHGGAPEMVDHGRTGFLMPWDDPAIAAGYIITLVNDAEARKKMGAEGALRVRKLFSEAAYYDHMEQSLLTLSEAPHVNRSQKIA